MDSGIERTSILGPLFKILNQKAKNFKYSSIGGLFFKGELKSRIKEKLVEPQEAVFPVKSQKSG